MPLIHPICKRQLILKIRHSRIKLLNTFSDAPIPGVSLTTCQPANTCDYLVLRYHTHMSHISRPISIYFSYKQPFSYNILQEFIVQLFYTFTCQNILKLDCSNIFYKNVSQSHNPAFFVLTASKERRLLANLKGGSHDGVSKAQY